MLYRVEEYVLDLRKFELRKNDDVVLAEPQVLSILFLLIENRDRLVTKDELVDAIWDGRAISDSAISTRIKSARKLLGDDGNAQRLIRTVHGKGFRFVGQVSAEEAGLDIPQGAAATPAASNRVRYRAPLLVAGFGALAVIGVLLWHPWKAGGVTVAVIAAAESRESDELARDLTAKFGMLTGVTQGATRLLGKDAAGKADLLLQVEASPHGDEIETSAALLNRKRELMWSTDFRRPAAQFIDLKQQMAFTAGAAIQCALDTQGAALDLPTIKTYLSGCAASNDVSEETFRDLRTTFEQVTQAAPRFEPGWKHLLALESTIVAELTIGDQELRSERARLQRTIAGAQRLDPAMPEIFVAQAVQLPSTDLTGRMRLADVAVGNDQDAAQVLTMRALLLTEVGRMADAVVDMRKAARSEPLSPTIRMNLITTLASAGRFAQAQEELSKAERLWPESKSLLEARYLLYLRFGDPNEAVRLRDSGKLNVSGAPFHGPFLEARSNPSPENVERALREARSIFSKFPDAIYQLAQAQVAFGREDELFAVLLNERRPYRADYLLQVLFRPAFHKFRHDPRFMQVAKRLGLLDYWRSSGRWPDFCLFEPDLPYDCKRVGAEVAQAA